MKVGILTHYDVNNMGAQLQMYALYNVLKGLGHDPYILTYYKNFDFALDEKLKNQVSIESVPYYIKNYVIAKGLRLSFFNARKYLANKMFREKQFRFQHYATADIDCAIVGSDEVFSIPVGVNIMMYGHALPTRNVFSYAPSFGQTDMKLLRKHGCIELIASGLLKFKAISVRDVHTFNMVKELTGIEPRIVCDPVVLSDFYGCSNADVKLPKHRYLLVYSYDRSMVEPSEVKAITAFAKSNNLITVSVGTYHKWCDMNIVCNCLEWVEYFKGAEAVITDTFHGAIVSIMTNKPMAIAVRSLNVNKLTDLIKRTSLVHRRINEITYSEINRVFETDIDFSQVNQCVAELRKTGLKFLCDALDLCMEGNNE